MGKEGGEGIKTGDRKGVREGKRKKDRIVEGKVKKVREG